MAGRSRGKGIILILIPHPPRRGLIFTLERADDGGHASLQKTTRQTDAFVRQAPEVGNRSLAGRERYQTQIAQCCGVACHQVVQGEATLLCEEQGAIEGVVKPELAVTGKVSYGSFGQHSPEGLTGCLLLVERRARVCWQQVKNTDQFVAGVGQAGRNAGGDGGQKRPGIGGKGSKERRPPRQVAPCPDHLRRRLLRQFLQARQCGAPDSKRLSE